MSSSVYSVVGGSLVAARYIVTSRRNADAPTKIFL